MADSMVRLGVQTTEHDGADRDSTVDSFVREIARTPKAAVPPNRIEGTLTLSGRRLHVMECIGSGAMGVVYRAYDEVRNCSLALKALTRADAASIYRFKHEFRALSSVHHPNLVRLDQLFSEGDRWFFTMELVDGIRFDRWVRPHGDLAPARLRSALSQLASALEAVHAAGKVHRDLKPSNVLVAPDGRVVVLDFGLVSDHCAGGVGHTISEECIAGTPDYMAPEQAAGRPAVAASDLYAMGVMLYEALTGRLPFTGSVGEVLAAKQRDTPSWPSSGVDAAPDLMTLGMKLLSRAASERPELTAVRVCLDASELGSTAHVASGDLRADDLPLLGRERELAALRAAYESSLRGQASAVVVMGESGIGKTALCRAFLADLRQEGGAVVISARCYEHESVPFKALDPLVDELSRYLRSLPCDRAAALLPRDVAALAQLFPVLGRVKVVREAPSRGATRDPQELSRRALSAFAELLGRMRDRHPLVLWIDDLQWIDRDSAKFLRHSLLRRSVAPVFLMATHRSDDVAANVALRGVLDAAQSSRFLAFHPLPLGPLGSDESRRIARRCLAIDDEHASEWTLGDLIARESRGNPFLSLELARFVRSRKFARDAPLSLETALAARFEELPASARMLLEVVALCGQPLSLDAALRASGATYDAVAALRCAQLLRGAQSDEKAMVQCYHDRIRESVCASLSSDDRAKHFQALARELRCDEDADPDFLSRCFEGAGDHEEAARWALVAAERAFDAMAFERAASLYLRTLQLEARTSDHRVAVLLSRVGRALSNAGRGAEAAVAYEEAAQLQRGDERLELQRLAAEQWLATGHATEGTTLLRAVCSELDLTLPKANGSAALSIAWDTLRFRLGRPRRSGVALTQRDRLRLDTARTAVMGLIGYLPAQSAALAANYLHMARTSADIAHQVRSLGFIGSLLNLNGKGIKMAAQLLAQMNALAQEDGQPELLSFASVINGWNAYLVDDCVESRRQLANARGQRREWTGVDWELDTVNVFDAFSANLLGDYADLARTVPGQVAEALRRGRVWAAAVLSGGAGLPAWTTVDDVDGYERQLREVSQHWKRQPSVGWPDYMLITGEALLTIYTGDAHRGFDLLDQHRHRYRRSLWWSYRTGTASAGYATHWGRCAASALSTGDRAPKAAPRAQLRAALSEASAALRRNDLPRSRGVARMFEGALAADAGDEDGAVASLKAALRVFDQTTSKMLAAAVRRRLGQRMGGDEGRALIIEGERTMHDQRVRAPEPMTELCCPGFRKS